MKRVLIFFVLFLFCFSLISSAILHSSGGVNIIVDGISRTLDSGKNYFVGTHNYSSPASILAGQHDPNQIWVSVYSGETTLLQALQQSKLCPKSTKPLTYSLFPSNHPYHFATEIQLATGKNLQQAINDGNFSNVVAQCYNNDVYSYDSCGNSLGKTTDCGDDSCGDWGAEYCVGGHSKQDRTCHDRGCSSGACFDNAYTETRDNGEAAIYWCIENEPGGGGGGGKVICTELYTTGVMDEETYKMDLEYSAKHFSEEALKGYQAWAIPVVKAMRKSPDEAKRIVIPLVDAFIEEIAYRSGKSETGNEVGKLFLDEAVPLFERIGKYIDEPDWKSLFTQRQVGILDDKFLLYYLFDFKNRLEEDKYNKIVRNYFTEEKVREMFYDAERRGGDSQIAVAKALVENLEKAVEEIEAMISSLD